MNEVYEGYTTTSTATVNSIELVEVGLYKTNYVYEVLFLGKSIGKFVMDPNGDYYFWPNKKATGAWSSESLQMIAQKLDEVNGNEV